VGTYLCTHFLFEKNWRCFFINFNQDSHRGKDDTLVNEAIRFRELRLIDKDGNQLGILSARDAQRIARESELDLVCVAPQAKPPVCRIMNYSKYRYEQQRSAREAKKNQKVVEVKEIRLSPVIDSHDVETKLKNARKFLEKGNKVIVSVRFRGRMITFTDQGRKVLNDFAAACQDIAKIESESRLENRQLAITLAPLPAKKV
jgi:translation initiation factor IF-3